MNPQVDVRLELNDSHPVEPIWFNLHLTGTWAQLTVGFNAFAPACAQKLTLELSSVWDPIPRLIGLAESGASLTFPHQIDIDSEGPESRISLLPIGSEGLALFEVRDLNSAVIYLAGLVNPRQLADALATALADCMLDPDYAMHWPHWLEMVGGRNSHQVTHYTQNPWFREFIIRYETEGTLQPS